MGEQRRRLAEAIRREREKRGWRREDLAQATGASYRQIERWETGKSQPQAANLQKLAEVFEVDIATLRPDLEAEEQALREQMDRIEAKMDVLLNLFGSAHLQEAVAAADRASGDKSSGSSGAQGATPTRSPKAA